MTRPLLDDLAGQIRARALLDNALTHLSHAYLFVGPAQVGKLHAARLFAAAIECTDPAVRGCGQCKECKAVLGDNHPDVRVWDVPEGEKTFKIEQVRLLIQAVAFAPYQGRRKVHVLAALDALNPAGANALLKTLEEPPPATTLILLARDLDTVLPTLISRCQVIPFGLTPAEAIAAELHRRFPLPAEAARAIAHAAQGRIGRAFDLAGQPPDDAPPPAFPTPETILSWADAQSARTGDEQIVTLDALLGFVRDVIMLASGLGDETLRRPDWRQALANAADQAPLSAWLARARALEEARERLRGHANARLVWDGIARKLAAARDEKFRQIG